MYIFCKPEIPVINIFNKGTGNLSELYTDKQNEQTKQIILFSEPNLLNLVKNNVFDYRSRNYKEVVELYFFNPYFGLNIQN